MILENKYCIFSMVDSEDGCSKCAIHKWCLEHEKNPIEYKPYICSLFPLEGIKTPTGKIFVFCSDKHTRDFSMYFYTLSQRVCVNAENAVKVCAGDRSRSKYLKSVNRENFIRDDILSKMNPSYIEQEGVLRFLCGDEVYDKLLLKCIGTHM